MSVLAQAGESIITSPFFERDFALSRAWTRSFTMVHSTLSWSASVIFFLSFPKENICFKESRHPKEILAVPHKDYLGRTFPVACKDTGEIARNYQEYLSTEHWKQLRVRFFGSKLFKGTRYHGSLVRQGQSCFNCHQKDRLQVHHKTYRRLGREWLGDMIALCPECHKNLHEKFNELVIERPEKAKAKLLRYAHKHLPESRKRKEECRAKKRETKKRRKQKQINLARKAKKKLGIKKWGFTT